MPEAIIVALISLTGTALGSYSGIRLMTYRIEQLEKKVEKYNSIIERTFMLEANMKNANNKIENLERKAVAS